MTQMIADFTYNIHSFLDILSYAAPEVNSFNNNAPVDMNDLSAVHHLVTLTNPKGGLSNLPDVA